MNDSINLLKRLSKKELRQFKNYLNSLVGKNVNLLLLTLQAWEKDKTRTKTALFAEVFPGQTYHEQQWYTLMTYLQSQLALFLSMAELRQDKLLQKILLLRVFRRRNLQAFFTRTFKQCQKITHTVLIKNPRNLNLAYEAQELYYDYVASTDLRKNTNLQIASQQLDVFFISEKLKQICRAYSRRLVAKESYEIGLSKEVLDFVSNHPALLKVPTIQLYFYCCKAVVEEGSISDFMAFKHLLEGTNEGLSEYDMRDLFLMATNYSIKKHNAGEKNFDAITLNLYEQNLEKGYLIRDGLLPSNTLNNILGLAILVGRYDWAKMIINTYLPLVPKSEQSSLKALNLSRISYHQGDFNTAKNLLKSIAPRNKPFMFIGAKTLEIKIYFELLEYDDAARALKNFKEYLHREKRLNDKLLSIYLQFIYFSNRILKLAPYDKQKRAALIEEIKKNKEIEKDKLWMIKIIQSK